MSAFRHEPVLVRGAEAETIGHATGAAFLLTDSASTAGALSCHRVLLAAGADGSAPHYHARSSELFYVVSGAVQLLNDDKVVEAGRGDLVVVPPFMPHAFAAVPGSEAELLITITPGVDRFDYFRLLGRIVNGEAPYSDLLAVEDSFDSHSVQSEIWAAARSPQAA
ncbi:cupin domain-containing protein [Streptomyces siamensis]|uniref:Cupin domain-containing protein n=1 Tax=Streptomyces siamensis TaxID=1274986 RepID=A0ABP9IZK1_9ACTN